MTGASCVFNVDKDCIPAVRTVSDTVCCITVGSQCYMLCFAADMLIIMICWTVLSHMQTNEQDIKPVMTAWLVVSIFSAIPSTADLGMALFLTQATLAALLLAVVSLAGLAAAVIGMIDFRYWQRNKGAKSTR